jgi:ribulose-phosphate 3-epimerase
MNNITISPSILAGNLLNIETEIMHLNKVDNIWLHLDVMDGHFVPNLTFGPEIVARISKIATMPLDMHLMVNNPIFHLDACKNFGIHHVTLHWEAVIHNWREVFDLAKKHYKSVGISIKPKTEISELPLDLLRVIDMVLIMSVEPGFYGQKFIETSIDKVKSMTDVKTRNKLNFNIQVDGGVSINNIQKLVLAGANNFVAGNSVFKDGYLKYQYFVNELRNLHA